MTVFYQPNEFSALLAELFYLTPSERAFSCFSQELVFSCRSSLILRMSRTFLARYASPLFLLPHWRNLAWAQRTWNISMTKHGDHSGDIC